MKKLLFLSFLCVNFFIFSQISSSFQTAYTIYPNLPNGVLEAISWSNTRMKNISIDEEESCIGLPRALGVMGMFYDGKSYFRENGNLITELTGISMQEQLDDPHQQILGYAQAFNYIYNNYLTSTSSSSQALYHTLIAMSEIPNDGDGGMNSFALDAQIYQVFRFMNDSEFAQKHGFTVNNYDLESIFGLENLKVLSANQITITSEGISNELGESYSIPSLRNAEYGQAIWDPVPSCNYNSRNGVAISAIAVHTIQGSYAGAISWAKNCDSNVSYHYVIRSSDGQVAQLVLEQHKAWHIGSENPYTIGYEHEGWVNDASWYTQEMYESSAALTKDIVHNRPYGIPSLRTYYGPSSVGLNVLGGCTKIKGHQHYPNQNHTDPGIHWNWEKYYQLINDNPSVTTVTSTSGTLYDTGGSTGDYGNDERELWLIQPAGASSVSINFTEFQLEENWDFLFLYDGATTNAPLIGKYTGSNSPGSVTSSGGSLLIEFRSDCATTSPGWAVNYTSGAASLPITSIAQGNVWYTSDFIVNVEDVSANSSISERYYLVQDRSEASSDWFTQVDKGFAFDNFDVLANTWVQESGTFSVNNGRLLSNDITSSNTNIYMNLNQSQDSDYLYSWTQRFIGNSPNQRGGIHFMCSNPSLTNRGDSYFVYLREENDKVQIYSVNNDVYTLQTNDDFTINNLEDYHVKVTFSSSTGWIRVFVNGLLASEWQDPSPLQSGNSVSFRTANAEIEFDNFRVYKSRSNFVSIPTGTNGLLRYESENGIPTGRMFALSRDAANWSIVDTAMFLLDKTSAVLNFINDGVDVDINEFSGQTISGNWSFKDIHSGVQDYQFAVGSVQNSDDIIPWTSVGTDSVYSSPFSNGVEGQTYYISVRALNGAGLIAQASSNGQKYLGGDLSIGENVLNEIVIYPNPFSNQIKVENLPLNSSLTMFDAQGRVVYASDKSTENEVISLHHIRSGVYFLQIRNGEYAVQHKVTKK